VISPIVALFVSENDTGFKKVWGLQISAAIFTVFFIIMFVQNTSITHEEQNTPPATVDTEQTIPKADKSTSSSPTPQTTSLEQSPLPLLTLTLVFLVGLSRALTLSPMTYYLTTTLRMHFSCIGKLAIASTILELPSFAFLAPRLSVATSMNVAMTLLVARAVAFSLGPVSSMVYIAESLQGVTFALFWCAVIGSVDRKWVGVISAVMFGLSVFFGNLIGGYLYGISGPTGVFQLGAGVSIAAYGVASIWLKNRQHKVKIP